MARSDRPLSGRSGPASAGLLLMLMLMLSLAGCGGSDAPLHGPDGGSLPLVPGAGPDGRYFHPPASGEGKSLQTQWPIILSHAWSRIADTSFQGDTPQPGGEFDPYGVSRMLEAGGAIVYLPDKLAYASSETRGELLYRKCAGTTLAAMRCEHDDAEVVDGVYLATLQYCDNPSLRARHGYADADSCQRGLKFNIICHSQGCADSRYMMAAVRNAFSGELMYRHVASWTSMAGANKGTAQADWVQQALLACLTPDCRSRVLDAAFLVHSVFQNQALIARGGESVVALTRKYMMDTTDMDCVPEDGVETCPPSFNMRYPFPDDPAHPVLYQSFTSQIDDISHPCYQGNRFFWDIVNRREGPNDGNISVDSQRFTSYGRDPVADPTPVIPRWVNGRSDDPSRPHPGLNHMAYSSSEVPGIAGVSCSGEDNRHLHFSRLGLYRDIVAELAAAGY